MKSNNRQVFVSWNCCLRDYHIQCS